jgi:chromosome segregation ATPase
MRVSEKLWVFVLLVCLFSSTAAVAATDPATCLVIGVEGDPVKGRAYFKSAMEQWLKGQKSEAVESYERAIIADHSILKHEDHGMANALLEKYRDVNASQTPALLCKRAFLENILIGNLDESIEFYEKASEVAEKEQIAEMAKAEAERLSEELQYLREWQASVREANARLRRKDLEEYLAREKREDLQEEVEDNSLELEELQERLAYLQKQEKEVAEEMYTSVRHAARYRRRYYYPGSYQATGPDPDAQNVPPGNWGSDNASNNQQVPNPYSQQTGSGVSGKTALYRYYAHRGSARRHQEKLAQIRAEISGVYRRIAQIKKASKEIREELNNNAVKTDY